MGRGRGVNAVGGQSSLGYLFGSGETTSNAQPAQNQGPEANNGPSQKTTAAASQPIEKHIAAGVPAYLTNNYFRADGQNCGNFITNRPSTKVQSAPGGASSLGYLFGGVGD
ncbi:protein SPIRAL1-like 2 [Castanea sativa]|uniref:protein SPIRAL1-like 2 n=1 Tax=Castanea sativa TaxID=21020 RepID=UPI003F64C0CF